MEPGRQWATWLHQALETYEVPNDLVGTVNDRGEVIPARIFPVFRDEEELPVDAELISPIYRALDNSKYLLVICSPRAVASAYVASEILYFKQLGREDRVLAAIVDGEPNVTQDLDKQVRGFRVVNECFPEPLRHKVDREGRLLRENTEPIAADFRLDEGGQGWCSPEAYRLDLQKDRELGAKTVEAKVAVYQKRLELMKLKIVAGVLGVPLGTLTQRDKAYQLQLAQRRARVLRRWLSAVTLLAVTALIAGGMAFQQSDRRRLLLREAARSDHSRAQELVDSNQKRDALACLARSIDYDPASTLAAEAATILLNGWDLPVMTINKDGERLATSTDGSLILIQAKGRNPVILDVKTGKIITTLQTAGKDIGFESFSPDNQQLLATGEDETYQLWSVKSGEVLSSFKLDLLLSRIIFSPDGSCFAALIADAETVAVYDAATGKVRAKLEGHQEFIRMFQFSQDGRKLVTASSDGTAKLWDASAGKLLTTLNEFDGPAGNERYVGGVEQYVELSLNNSQALTFGWKDFSVHVWNTQSGKPERHLEHKGMVEETVFSPDGSYIAVGAQYIGYIWETATGRKVAELLGHQDFVTKVQFSRDGQRLLTVSDDHVAKLWDVESGQLLQSLPMYSDQDNPEWTLTERGEITASISAKNRVMVMTATGGLGLELVGHQGPIRTAVFSTDGTRLLTATGYDKYREIEDRTARVWSTSSGELLCTLPNMDSGFYSESKLKLNADGRRIFSSLENEDKNRVWLWDVDAGAAVEGLSQSNDAPNVGEFSSDGRFLLTDSNTVWDAKKGEMLFPLRGAGTDYFRENEPRDGIARFSADGNQIISTGGGALAWVWDTSTGSIRSTLQGHQSRVTHATFSPNGKRVATASSDKSVRVWETSTGNALAKIEGFSEKIHGLAYTPDGGSIKVTGKQTTLWNAKNGKPLSFLGSDADFSEEEHGPAIEATQHSTTRGLVEFRKQPGGLLTLSVKSHNDYITTINVDNSGRQVVTACTMGSLRIWELLVVNELPPKWFPTFLRMMAQRKHDENGSLVDLPSNEFIAVHSEVKDAIARDCSRYGRIARRFLIAAEE